MKYTLVGEALVVASKMESGGLPGQIHCSGAFAKEVTAQANDVMVKPRYLPFYLCCTLM
jgi:class 3 adenylate cyclase